MSREIESILLSSFNYDKQKHTFSFKPEGCEYMDLQNATARFVVNEQVLHLEQASEWTWKQSAGIEEQNNTLFTLSYTFLEPAVSLKVYYELSHDSNVLYLEAEIENRSEQFVSLHDCDLIYVDAQRRGAIPLSLHMDQTVLFKYEMWRSCVQRIISHEGRTTSDFLNLMYNPVDQWASMISFITVGKLPTHHETVYQEGKGITSYRAWCAFNGYRLAPQMKIRTEKVKVELANNPYQLLEDWANHMQAAYQPKFNPKTTVGWLGSAWVDMLSSREPDSAFIIEGNARAIRERLAGFDIDYIWMSQVNLKDMLPGNWLAFNDYHFPDGFENTIKRLKEMDFTPGLWIAPFWVFEEATEVVAENEANFVRESDGTLNRKEIRWEFSDSSLIPGQKNKYYLLDGSKEGSLDFIEKVLKRYTELGIRYFMVDFLNDGWKHNVDMEPLTALECARRVLERLRAAAGPQTHLLSAVGSTPSYIGCFDAARINHDYGEGRSLYPPYHAHYNATYTVNDKFFSNLRSLLQNFTTNYFTHRKLYINDNNLLTIDKPLARNIAEMNATLFSLSGSPVMLGDDIRHLHPERLKLLKQCLPLTEQMMFPVDLFKNVYPESYSRILSFKVEKPWESYLLVAVFNLDDTVYVTDLDFVELGLNTDADESYIIYDFWAEEYLGAHMKEYRCEVPRNSCKLYRISQLKNHPWLLSTDMHIHQGNVEISDLQWDAETLTLKGAVTRPIHETGNLYFIMPKNYRLVNHEKHWLLKDMNDMTVTIRREITFDQPTVEWELQFAPLEYVSAWH